MITEKKLLKLSGKYTLIWLAISLFFWFVIFGLEICHAQTQTGYRIPPRQDIGGGRMTGDIWCQYGTNGVRFIIGTQAVTQVGTTGVLNGTNTNGAPSLDFTYGGGSLSANFNGFNAVYIAGSQVGTSGALTGKLDAVGGVGTNNTFNNPTLAGVGTMSGTLAMTGTLSANGTSISPIEIGYLDGVLSNIQGQIDTKLTKVNGVSTYIGSVTAGGKTGTSSFRIIDGSNISSSSTLSSDGVLEYTINATGSLSSSFATITGTPTDNSYFSIKTMQDNKVLYGIPDIIVFSGTTTAITGTSSVARLYNLQSVVESQVSGMQYLLHFNGGSGTSNFVDSSTFARTIVAVGSATHSPTQVKFGSTSVFLDGTGDSITTTNVTGLSPGAQTFYADCWAFYNGTKGSSTATLFGKRSGAGSWANDGHEYFLQVDDDNKLSFAYNSSNSPVNVTGTNTLAFTAGWHHYKVVNASTGFFMFFDGVLAQSAAKLSITATTGGTPKFVVGERNSDLYWDGYVDEMNFVLGVDGETSNFTPPISEYGTIYDKYTFSLIPPGTTTPSIKQEYGTASNAIITYLQGDLIVDKPSRYATATAYCAEFSLSKPILAQAYSLYPCDSNHKEIVETGSITPQQEAFNTILNTGIFKFLWKTPELAKARSMINELTKVDYGRKDYSLEKTLWEEVYKGNYVTVNEGSQTVNTAKMSSDFEAYYLNKQYFDFDNMSVQEKNELVYEKKKSIADTDKRNESTNIGIVLDRNCPEEFKLNDLPELSKMVQLEISALKEAAERIVRMEKEIKALKAIVSP